MCKKSNHIKSFIIVVLIMALFSTGCSIQSNFDNNNTGTGASDYGNSKANMNNAENKDLNSPADKSGPVASLPWENDKAFTDSMAGSQVTTLLAGFKTVLRDPLPGEEYNVHLAARMLCGITLKPGDTFSQNAAVGPYTLDRGFQRGPTYVGTTLTTSIGGGVCKIASTLYNVAISSNVKIVERHNHTMPVPYVPYGQDATVSYGSKDFKFMNNTGHNLMIWAKGIENTLYIAFYGTVKPPKIEWEHETLETTKSTPVYVTNNQLPDGTQKMLLEGMDGAIIRSKIKITDENGNVTYKNLGMSIYKPMNSLIEKGPEKS